MNNQMENETMLTVDKTKELVDLDDETPIPNPVRKDKKTGAIVFEDLILEDMMLQGLLNQNAISDDATAKEKISRSVLAQKIFVCVQMH